MPYARKEVNAQYMKEYMRGYRARKREQLENDKRELERLRRAQSRKGTVPIPLAESPKNTTRKRVGKEKQGTESISLADELENITCNSSWYRTKNNSWTQPQL